MGNSSSMLTQYDIEEVQEHCNHACNFDSFLGTVGWIHGSIFGKFMIKLRSFFDLISVSQQEILSLYNRFCQLDRNSGGFVSADEFMSVPEFAVNPLAQVGKLVLWFILFWFQRKCCNFTGNEWIFFYQRLLRMVDGLNFKEFVAFLSAFSPQTTPRQKIECQ